MRIQNKKTGIEYKVTPEDWEAIKNRGESSKYTILSIVVLVEEKEDDAKYSSLLRTATKQYKKGELKEALKVYRTAAAINPTQFIKTRIEEIERKLEE